MMDDVHVGEARLLRERLAELEARIYRRLTARAPGTSRRVGRVYSRGAIPTGSGKFYACHPVVVTGTEVEGGTPVLAVDTSRTFLVDLLGGTAAAGDDLVCRRVDHRWVAKVGAATPTAPTPAGSACISVAGCNSKQIDGATITLGRRSVTSIAVANGGSGYLTPPLVVVSNASGSGCTATAVISGGAVTAINVTNGGAYSSAPAVTLQSAGTGSGATATATLGALTVIGTGTTTGQVASLTRVNAGAGYTSRPTVTITGDGTGAAAVANISAPILSFTLANAGGGYTTAPTATVSTATGTGGSVRVLLTATTVASVAVTNPGSYTSGNTFPTATLTTPGGHTGSGATAATSVKAASIARIGDGADYTAGDLLTLVGGTASSPTTISVTSVDAFGQITGTAIQSAGSYTAFAPSQASVTGGSGTGATFDVTWQVLGVAVTAGGANYSTAPLVSLAGAGGAVAAASLTPVAIASVVKVAGGAYSATPTVALSGGGAGSGGAITATLDTFTVPSYTMTNKGSGYTTATVSVAPPGGGGATATATAAVNKQACFDIPTAGNYFADVSGVFMTRFTQPSDVVALTATPDQARSVQLTPDPAYICFTCSGTTSAYPIKRTLHYTTPGGRSGSVTLSGSAWNVQETYNVPCCDLGGGSGDIVISWILATSPAAGGAFGCFSNSQPKHCSATNCAPASDAAATNPVMSVQCFTPGTGVWTLPETAGAFSFLLSGVSVSGVFSGSFTWSE